MTTTSLGSAVLGKLRSDHLLRSDEAITDGHLLETYIASRDEAAFEAILHRHGRMVLGVCRRVLGDTADVEDAFQATFLVLVRKARSIVPRELVGNWLYGVAHRTATSAKIMKARRSAKERAGVKPESHKDDPVSDLWPVLDQELSILPDKYRAAIVLCDIEGKTQKEAARQLDCPEGTVSTRLRTARSMLARALTRRGVTFSGAMLVSLLAQAAASAGVPPAMTSSTLRAATLLGTGQSTAGEIPAQVLALVEGVLKTMLVSKLRLALAGLLVVAFVSSAGVLAACRSVDGPLNLNHSHLGVNGETPGEWVAHRRAPVPKTKPDPGLIWVYNMNSGVLTAYTPDGQKARELKIPDGNRFLGFTPDGRKIAFRGKDGKLAKEDDDEATLHLRDVNDKTEGSDTGLRVTAREWLIWSVDSKRTIRVRNESKTQNPVYAHTLFDMGTKKETQLDLPHGHQAFGIAPDGESVLTVEVRPVSLTGDVYKVPFTGVKPVRLADRELDLMSARFSPDGRTVVCFGRPEKPLSGEPDHPAVYLLDVKTGAVTKSAVHSGQVWSRGFWAPDGSRIAYFWTTEELGQPTLVVCDKDGRNSKTLAKFEDATQSLELLGWFPTVLFK